MSRIGVKRLPIGALGPGTANVLVVGIIIAKQNPRKIKAKTTYEDRGVWCFTIRDSPYDFINVNFWGTNHFISEQSDCFNIGDVVEITNPRVSTRKGEQEDRYNPSVTSQCQLSITEGQSLLKLYEGEDIYEFSPLLHLTTKPPTDFFSLADVHANNATTRGELVNLLVVVRDIRQMKTVKTKDGREMICRELLVMDHSCSSLPVQLWNSANAVRAENWQPLNTVLFLADMRVEWSEFKHSMVASDCLCTIVTENPHTPESYSLRELARTVPIRPTDILEHLINSIPDPNSIRQVMTVQQVLEKAALNYSEKFGDHVQFTALLYCVITYLDLDGYSKLTITKCSRCHIPIENFCINLECPVGSGTEMGTSQVVFDLRVRLTDHTGSLENCRLIGSVAERVLKCSAEEFMLMSLDAKTDMKWHLLMERCAIRVAVLRPSNERMQPLISIVACDAADPVEVSTHIPIF